MLRDHKIGFGEQCSWKVSRKSEFHEGQEIMPPYIFICNHASYPLGHEPPWSPRTSLPSIFLGVRHFCRDHPGGLLPSSRPFRNLSQRSSLEDSAGLGFYANMDFPSCINGCPPLPTFSRNVISPLYISERGVRGVWSLPEKYGGPGSGATRNFLNPRD